jgi:hypothetical protein
MKRKDLQTKTWQSIGFLQWHKLCTTLKKKQKYLDCKVPFLVAIEHGEKFMLGKDVM